MRHIILALPLICAGAVPLAAQDDDTGTSLMERGAQLFLEGLLKEVEPAIDDLSGLAEDLGPALRSFTEEMGPKMREMLDQVEDWSAYEPPEIMPNGDIVIRRKTDRPLEKPITPAPQVDL